MWYIYTHSTDNRPVDQCWYWILGARGVNHINTDRGNSNLLCRSYFYTSSLLSQPLAPYQEAECVGLQIFLNSFGYFNKCLLLCDSIENPLENPVVCNILRTELPPWFGVIRIFRWEVGPRAFYFGSTILLYFHRVTVTLKGFDTFDFLKY